MFQTFADFLVFLGWLWENITAILHEVFLPIQYIYTFIANFFSSAFSAPVAPENFWSFDSGVISLFHSVPYFSELVYACVLGLTAIMIFYLLRTFLKT